MCQGRREPRAVRFFPWSTFGFDGIKTVLHLFVLSHVVAQNRLPPLRNMLSGQITPMCLRRFLVSLLAVLTLCFAAPDRQAFAQTLPQTLSEETVSRFLADSFPDTEAGIAAIVSAGVPHGAAVLEALGDRRLFASAGSRGVFYKDSAGKGFDARTGQPADVPGDAAMVRLNNRLRGIVLTAVGSMTLLAPDPAPRCGGIAHH
jgi:hypothetical protein